MSEGKHKVNELKCFNIVNEFALLL